MFFSCSAALVGRCVSCRSVLYAISHGMSLRIMKVYILFNPITFIRQQHAGVRQVWLSVMSKRHFIKPKMHFAMWKTALL